MSKKNKIDSKVLISRQEMCIVNAIGSLQEAWSDLCSIKGDLFESEESQVKLIRNMIELCTFGLKNISNSFDRHDFPFTREKIRGFIKEELNKVIFSKNDMFVRQSIKSNLSIKLEEFAKLGYLRVSDNDLGFSIICDESNNLKDIIDSGCLQLDVFFKPCNSDKVVQISVMVTPKEVKYF